ncbi:sugar phosphate isomerase/epimerase family protein [Salinimonas lutimaris]|uniref:sugar phosphate isomerase/epimerase family protein n=1 Tax=Salinimonas lutimaris TaxID=914153 RepID=UPI0010BFEEC8|nr:sugar phosphate isomerase/epimerase family protein [Salinimonas lutimaris]
MTQFGTCTWTLGELSVERLFSICQDLQLSCVQFHGDHLTHQASEVKNAASESGITIWAIDPFYATPPAASFSLSDAEHYFMGVVDFARATDCCRITVHALSHWISELYEQTSMRIEMLALSCQKICDYAARDNITVLFELCNQYEVAFLRTTKEWAQLAAQVNRDNFGLILDSFHMHMEEPDSEHAMLSHGSSLQMYHISDSNRGGIGSGQIDFYRQFCALKETGYQGPVMLEVVLPQLTPCHAPATAAQWQQLSEHYQTSFSAWQEFEQAYQRNK